MQEVCFRNRLTLLTLDIYQNIFSSQLGHREEEKTGNKEMTTARFLRLLLLILAYLEEFDHC